MKIEIEANTIPENAKPIAVLGVALYIDPKDGHRHLAVPFEISPTANREEVLLTHEIMQGFGEYFRGCKRRAHEEYLTECRDLCLKGLGK